jgi:hypothetical protein
MTSHIWNEHTDHGQAPLGSLRRRWQLRMRFGHTAWLWARRPGPGLLLVLGGVWVTHWQGMGVPSAMASGWTQARLLVYLQAVALGTLSWFAALLVVATLLLGCLLLLAAGVRQGNKGWGWREAPKAQVSVVPSVQEAVR